MASIEDRSTSAEARFQVRWREGRVGEVRSYTFRAPIERGKPTAQKAAQRLKAYVDLMGHQLPVLEALVGAGFRVEGVSNTAQLEEGPTLRDWSQRWLAQVDRPNARSLADYRRILDEHILPVLGDVAVVEVSAEQIGLWLRGQRTSETGRGTAKGPAPPSEKSIANRHGVLSALLDGAEKAGLRVGNPAKGLGPTPKSTHRDMRFLTHQEWALLHTALKRPGVRAVDETFGQHLATLLVGSGMRWSEATALTVGQCDLIAERALVRVDRAWKRLPGGTYAVGEPKSARGVRSVDVPEQVREVLIERAAGRGREELVFPAPEGGIYLSSWFYDRYWAPSLTRAAEAGLEQRPRVHDLRHTHAAWLIADGRPLASIQRRLGHESITTTIDRYGHLLPELEAGNADAIERAMAVSG